MEYQIITQRHIDTFVDQASNYITTNGTQDSVIIGLSRGGLVPAVYISHRTDVPMIPIDYSAEEGRGTSVHTNILMPLNKYTTIYIVDDIVDTGKTVQFLKQCYESQGHIVHVLAVVEKSHSVVQCDLSQTLIANPSLWVVFPWEPEFNYPTIVGEGDVEKETQETKVEGSEGAAEPVRI